MGSFGQSKMHSIFDFCPRLVGKDSNVPLLKISQALTVLICILCPKAGGRKFWQSHNWPCPNPSMESLRVPRNFKSGSSLLLLNTIKTSAQSNSSCRVSGLKFSEFKNYVDRILPFFDPPPTCVDSFYTLSVDHTCRIQSTRLQSIDVCSYN